MLRWYRSKKVQNYLSENDCTDFLRYLMLVMTIQPSTAGIESEFSHVNGRAGNHALELSNERLLDMLVLRSGGKLDADRATTPLTIEPDGLDFLKYEMPAV